MRDQAILLVSVPKLLRVRLTMLLVDGSRYVIPAGLAFLVFWVWKRERFRRRLIQGPNHGHDAHYDETFERVVTRE